MNKLTVSLICCLSLAIAIVFGGCEDSTTASNESPISIALSDQIPTAIVGESYDLSSLITEEENTTYEYFASYVDPKSGETKDLKVKNSNITPKVEADIAVSITASRGEDSSSINFIVPIRISADIMDTLLSTNGIAGQSDAGVTKVVTKNPSHIYENNSISALEVSFPGSDNGVCVLTLSHYALLPYYSAQVWHNAAVTFYVYNPMEQDVHFKLSSYNPKNDKTLLWDSPENTQIQTAKPGQWTQIAFSLYDMGIEQPLFNAVEYRRDDFLIVMAQYAGSKPCTVYIDGIDIVHANTVEGLKSGYIEASLPTGNFSDLLNTCKVYTEDSVAQLSKSAKGNDSADSYQFGSYEAIGHPTFYMDFPQVTDISGFDYLKFDILAENAYPYVTATIRYLDENGKIQIHGTGYDYYNNNQWQTIYLNLDYLHFADLTKVVGFSFSVHMDSRFVAGKYNCVYFDNVSLYDYPGDEPQMAPAIIEDNDIISGPFYTTGTKSNVNGVCKVATDEVGKSRSNSALMFWTNNACGYPNVEATFLFDTPQDWSKHNILSFDTHQANGHYWLQFNILYLDQDGNQQTAYWRYDAILTAWQTNHASLDWFVDKNGEHIKPDQLTQVVGFRIAANMAINVTGEVAQIFFDNFYFS